MTDEIILVDHLDNEIGFTEKDPCHRIPVKLHRAFSIFIVNDRGHMLIQKRSSSKKTWPGFWSNACCSHPRKGESLLQATSRRLDEELGFTCPLQHITSFRYEAAYDKELGEHEIDHVFVGHFGGLIQPNKDEIEDLKFIPLEKLTHDIDKNPEKYTPWFKKALPGVLEFLKNHSQKGAGSGS
ncbi:MAG: isopentenyl-diphosphate Delta-isomerase [Syntrophorhabdus sp.]|nr:isopentenyl-diphosphate Delta-isomerase [Syntrophorhabdus sp.]NMC93834.1 isopentenyl-diphosphate Delta-isomerase [Syntrophorhabdus sp.]